MTTYNVAMGGALVAEDISEAATIDLLNEPRPEAADPVYAIDAEGRVVGVCDGCYRRLGVRRDDGLRLCPSCGT